MDETNIKALAQKFGMSDEQYQRARAAFKQFFIGSGAPLGGDKLPPTVPGRYGAFSPNLSNGQPRMFGSPVFADVPPPNTTVVPKTPPITEEAPPLPKRKPKKGKKGAALDVPNPDVIRVGEATPQALAAAVKGATKPLVIDGAMDLGLPSDRMVVMPGKAKVDPAKVAQVRTGTPVVSQQGFVDVMRYIRGQ